MSLIYKLYKCIISHQVLEFKVEMKMKLFSLKNFQNRKCPMLVIFDVTHFQPHLTSCPQCQPYY